MSFFRAICGFAFVLCTVSAGLCAAPQNGAKSPQSPPILPQQFAGWQMQGTPQSNGNAASADPANAPILKEYRFTDYESATYTRDDGRTLKVRAARFADASGAFGAYTFYRQPDMTKEDIGDQGSSLGEHVLFYRGHILIDALFSKESVMSAAQLRELAGDLPRPGGSAGNLPTFIEFMPRQNYVPQTQKYVMGPAALTALNSPISADLVDFGASAEVTLGRYSTPGGEATLALISYPTPQLAAEHLKRIDGAHPASSIESANAFVDRRTGPIVVVASGPISQTDAKALSNHVNWEATVTWNQPTDSHEVHDLYMLILNIVVLCGILAGLAIVAGIAFGGVRILVKRLYPDRVFDRPEQMEFISLHLTETAVKGAPNASGAGPQAPANQA